MKTKLLQVAIACLILACSSSAIVAQSANDDAYDLFTEALQLERKASSRLETEAALAKYNQALQAFVKIGADAEVKVVLGNIIMGVCT